MNRLFYFICFYLCAFAAQASVVVGGTRVIFDGTQKSTTVSVQNKDNVTNIVQSWISVVDAASPAKDSFITTPPLFRLKSGEQGFVRILRSGKPLAEDRESMFWLNIKGIPAMENAPDKNMVQFAINSRIKLIFRPAADHCSFSAKFSGMALFNAAGRKISFILELIAN